MRILSFLVGAVLMIGCSSSANVEKDKEKVQSLLDDYVQGWLEDDTMRVMGIFSDDAVIIPSGIGIISGKEAMMDFWFPDDSSKTVINSYEIDVKELRVNGQQAFSIEEGNLSFNYTKGDFFHSAESRSNAVTVYEKMNGEWKVVSRSWTDLKN